MIVDDRPSYAASSQKQPETALVVGGSLVGLATAIRLARCGLSVSVLERGRGFGAEGAGLGIDRQRLSSVAGLSAVDGHTVPALPVIVSNRESTTWREIYRWLRSVADRHDRIEVRSGNAVTDVTVEAGQGQALVGGDRIGADLVIGADGRGSVVRRAVAPEHPIARYAGYGLWRGLIEERHVPDGLLPTRSTPVGVHWAEGQRLVAYVVPGSWGGTTPGERALNWAWYDAKLTPLFEATGCLRGNEVLRSLRQPELDPSTIVNLQERAAAQWPEPWRTAIIGTIKAGRVFATPIAEYLPVRLVSGPLAIIGDAAHVASPMTGAGLITGLDDVEALGLAVEAQLADGPSALAAYEAARLAPGKALAMSSMRWSRDYLTSIRSMPRA